MTTSIAQELSEIIGNAQVNNFSWKYFLEYAKVHFLSTDIGKNLLKNIRIIRQAFAPAKIDIITAARRAFLFHVSSAICWSLLVQFLLAIQFHIFVNAKMQLKSWFSDSYNGIRVQIVNSTDLFSFCFCHAAYGFLLAEFYTRPTVFCKTRSDFLLYVGVQKLLLFVAQILFVLWSLHIFKTYLSLSLNVTYMNCTAVFVILRNFWKHYLFQELKIKFELINAPRYEQICFILRPRLWTMLKRVFNPLCQFTLLFLVIEKLNNLVDEYLRGKDEGNNFKLTSVDLYSILCTWIMLAESVHAIQILNRLIIFELTRYMEFTVKMTPGKLLLREALQMREINPWIFENAVRDFFDLSKNETRYRDLYIMPNEQTQYLWKDISDLSLEIINEFPKKLDSQYESPDKLLDKQQNERALYDNKAQNIFKSLHGRTGFMVNLKEAPTLCSCPLGPMRPNNALLEGVLNYFLWISFEFAYMLLDNCKLFHIWHFLFCPTFGCNIRYLLQDYEFIQNIICAFSNICTAAYKDTQMHVIKFSVSPFIKALISLIDVLEIVPFHTYKLYGLDKQSFGKLKSLKAHAKYSLFNLLQCYQDKLFLVFDDQMQDINRVIRLYEWPIKLT